jgi:conjugal transfer/type IV secretion protein DotA/TraY
MMRFKKLFLFLTGGLTALAPSLARAQSATTSSAGGFSIPSGDISEGLITQVLGSGWQNWMSSGSTSGAGSVLAAMLSTYNTAILTVVAGIMVYTHAAGIADTAHKGELDNQRHHTLWTPVRQALALGMLAPAPGLGGISMIQAGVVYCVMASIGMADTVYTSAITYMSQNGGQITALPTSGPQAFGVDEVGQLLKSAVTADYLQNQGFTGGSFSCQANSSSTMMCSVSGETSGGDTVPFGAMGGVTLTCGAGTAAGSSASGASTAMCSAREQGVMAAWQEIARVATAIMSWQGASGADTSVSSLEGDVGTAIADYDNDLSGAYGAIQSSETTGQSTAMSNFKTAATSEGWASAGRFYYEMGQLNQTAQAAMEGGASVLPADGTTINPLVDQDYDAFEQAAENYMNAASIGGEINTGTATTAATGTASNDANGDMSGFAATAIEKVQSFFGLQGLMSPLVNFAAGGDPIMSLQTTGNLMLDAAEGGILAYGAAQTTYNVAKGQGSTWEGWAVKQIPIVGNALQAAQSTAGSVLSLIGPIIWAVALSLLIAGITLAYYLPMAPAILFGLGVISWLILVLEAFVAAPLWAAAHALPGGGGLTGEGGKQGYNFLIGLLLRPVLLVIGLFISLGIMQGAAGFFIASLDVAFQSEWQGKIFGIVTLVASVLMLCGATYAMTNRVVGVITWFPDSVVGWIGARAASMGEERHEQIIAGYVGHGSATVEHGTRDALLGKRKTKDQDLLSGPPGTKASTSE